MKWVLVSNSYAAIQEFHLFKEDKCKVVLKYNPLHSSVRLKFGVKHHGLFYIEKSTHLSTKAVFKNQYGMEIGSLVAARASSNEGVIVLHGKQFNYRSQNQHDTLLAIYESNPAHPLVVCGIKQINETIEGNDTTNQYAENSFFLLGLCWFLLLSVNVENEIGNFA